MAEKVDKYSGYKLRRASCPCCHECWVWTTGPLVGSCLFGGPFTGFYEGPEYGSLGESLYTVVLKETNSHIEFERIYFKSHVKADCEAFIRNRLNSPVVSIREEAKKLEILGGKDA